MTSVTPMSRTIGNGKPVGICQPPGGRRTPVLLGRDAVGEALRPEVGVGERGQAEDGSAADDAESTSAHIGRSGKP